MDIWSHDRFTFPLPPAHRFPLTKYALLRARLEADGIARPDEIHECEPAPWAWIEAVQEPALVERLRTGTLSSASSAGSGCRGRPRSSSVPAARPRARSPPRDGRSRTAWA